MKDYRRILEVSADATEEQIKAQYKRLVRIYHPDRFANAEDKLYVEQKLQEVNEAYRFLLHPAANTFTVDYGGVVPQPIALPAILDFGELAWGKQQTLVFHVENSGGIAQSLQLEYSDVDGWFKVTKGRRLYPQQPFPMEFAVVVDTARLEVGKSYQGWIQVKMDNAATQVALAVRVVAKQPLFLLSPRLALLTSLIALLLIIGTVQFSDQRSFVFWENRITSPTQTDPAVFTLVQKPPVQSTDITPTPGGHPELSVQPAAPTSPATAQALAVAISPTATAGVIQARSAISFAQTQASPIATATLLPSTDEAILPPTEMSSVQPHKTPVSPHPAVNISQTLLVAVPDNYYVNGRADTLVESAVLQILPSGSKWVAIGRSQDAQWLLLQVDNEQLAWVAAPSVIATADIATLPIANVTEQNR